jgi:elongation factor Ts
MQIAALNPQYVSRDEIPGDVLSEKAEQVGSKEVAVKQLALLEQEFIKDSSKTIEEVIKDNIAKLGENIVVRRFSRFELGETAPNESEDNEE